MFDLHDSSRPLRLGFLLAVLVWTMAAASYALAEEPRWILAIGSATAAPQTVIELPVVLTTGGAPVSALAFSIEFDPTKLVLDGGPTLGSKLELPAPSKFTSSSWVGSEAGQVGVVVYDSTRPLGVLADGPIARVRFRSLPDATGFAAVRIATTRPYSASGPRGERLEGSIADGGGIMISAPSGSASELVETPAPDPPRAREEERARVVPVAIPLAREAGPDSSPRAASVILHNGDAHQATARLTVLSQTGVVLGPLEISVPPGATRSWSNPALEVPGAILVERSSARLLASGGSEAPPDHALPVGEGESRLVAVESTAAAPRVVAVANFAPHAARFLIDVLDEEGALVDTRTVDVSASSIDARTLLLPFRSPLTVVIRPGERAVPFLAWTAATSPPAR